MITFVNVNPYLEYIIKEIIEDVTFEHSIKGDERDAFHHYELLAKNKPACAKYILELYNPNGVIIKRNEYEPTNSGKQYLN